MDTSVNEAISSSLKEQVCAAVVDRLQDLMPFQQIAATKMSQFY